jgi:hypothetical protein
VSLKKVRCNPVWVCASTWRVSLYPVELTLENFNLAGSPASRRERVLGETTPPKVLLSSIGGRFAIMMMVPPTKRAAT